MLTGHTPRDDEESRDPEEFSAVLLATAMTVSEMVWQGSMTRWHRLCVAEDSTAERDTACEYSWRHYSSDTAQRTLLASLYLGSS